MTSLLRLYMIIATVVITVATSCRSTYPIPVTRSDSAKLLARCTGLLPADTVYRTVAHADSSEYWKGLATELVKVYTDTFVDVQTKYQDTCRSAIATYQQGVTRGYNTGYANGRADGAKREALAVQMADSAGRAQVVKLRQTDALQAGKDRVTIEQINEQAEKWRGRAERRGAVNLWLIILCAVLLILNILQWKFKRVEKTANTVINDVRKIVSK